MVKNPDISLCGDLANGLKHGREGIYHFGAMSFSVPDESVNRITYRAGQVELDVKSPENVEYRLPVLDQSDKNVGDAFEYAERAITALEHFRSRIEK